MIVWAFRLRPRTLIALLLLLISFVLVLPALVQGDALGGDASVHVNWQAHFAEQVWHGTLYPRWLPDISKGFGSPAFFFYPPMAQWFGALFGPLLPGPGHAMARLILGVWLTSAIGGWGCWLWLRTLGLTIAHAGFGALVFLLLPYRCFVDFYQRGALAELTALNAMPWLLFGASLLQARRRGGFGAYALAVSAILYCNLPGSEIGILFSTAYVLALAGLRDLRFLASAAGATVTGFLIGALGVAPLLTLFPYLINTFNLWGGRNVPGNWLLFASQPWVDHGMYVVTIFFILFSLAAGAMLSPLALRDRAPAGRRVVWFLGGTILLVAVLNTELARAFWAPYNPLSRIQFPFRLLSASTVAVAGLAALALHAAAAWDRRISRLLWLALPALFLLDATLLGVQTWRDRHDRQPTNQQMIADNMDAMEYVLGRMDVVRPRFGDAPAYAVTGNATARAIEWRSRDVKLDATAATDSALALRQFAFTGWECRVDGGAWVRADQLAQPLNLPVCRVPAGHHVLEARLPPTPIERIGGWLTLLGLVLALGSIALGRDSMRALKAEK